MLEEQYHVEFARTAGTIDYVLDGHKLVFCYEFGEKPQGFNLFRKPSSHSLNDPFWNDPAKIVTAFDRVQNYIRSLGYTIEEIF